ncbi:cupin domain-containing protein [Pseudovibrio sp. JE062]|uniref:cupin domain-containing protein n=1 Tax=Pseudovibrio sp. JE062 TaxID=439495 RepID=UPI000186C1EF|nr:cupin domain-containing protein [Pseudovibrio sp. JE062]EEA93767.1 cupin superfamily protein [Pseudovibrio sp. JE062]
MSLDQITTTTADEIIAELQMKEHPEGGYYTETFRDTEGPKGRGYSTAIYYLLKKGQKSHWHRIDAIETWHYYGGAPLKLSISTTESEQTDIILGMDVLNGQRPQGIVPREAWQSAQSLGEWTLVGCTVAPGFLFDGFELAPPDWNP